ncbi:probable pectate lyase 5 isoform X2 [Beta vulgaris subsp. vulgaris]|uniref:probable pectate lyase 5 isoform X2 n=1 Tax=Beta vulgaris subsp. vulgaris TaxID=3555 RepID=UPI002037361B|nr:probable pectate lyase 5 isoform X2 [Beta vulgaris subsp. vulgaris]
MTTLLLLIQYTNMLLQILEKRAMHHLFLFLFTVLSFPTFIQSIHVPNPQVIAQQVQEAINVSRRNLATNSCKTGNPIDDCWQCDKNWDENRQQLADCAIGFGKNAVGGKKGKIYIVKDPSDDAINPKRGTLRYGVIQNAPLWIVFAKDMVIKLQQVLLINSFKTIDGRGANVHIADGACIVIEDVNNIIIHGIHIHDCKRGGIGYVRYTPTHYGWRSKSDGDGISIISSRHIWVDHCSLSRCIDGLIDAIRGSTAITISNNYMSHHNKVMLLGHNDNHKQDKNMQVTIAYNHFGEGLVQRMPRCRHGYFHVVNNDYTKWEMYAIGGSAEPTINSQGNRFLAPDNRFTKEVTKRENASEKEWKKWNWRSEGDLFLNGAKFVNSGNESSLLYAKAMSLSARPASLVASMTKKAGVLICHKNRTCSSIN